MATNYIQEGATLTVTAPAAVSSGGGVLIGTLFGVALTDAGSGASVEIGTEGVYTLGKTSVLAIAVGDRVFWDNVNGVVNKTATAQVCIGVAVSAAANPSATVSVKLGGATPSGT